MKSMKISPVSVLKNALKDELFKDSFVAEFVKGDKKRIQKARFSDIGEEDIPLITISAGKEEISELSYNCQERSHITVFIEIFGYPEEPLNIDDFVYHVRSLLRTMNLKALTNSLFTGINFKEIVYIRDKAGTKRLQHVVLHVITAYDDEIMLSLDAEDFEGVIRRQR